MARKKDPKNNIKPKHVDVHNQRGFDIYPNQKHVTVAAAKPRAPYCSVENRYMYPAMQKLNHATFKVYMYCCDNANGFRFALSSRDVEQCTGISGTTYDRAVRQLIDEGYLIPFSEYLSCEKCKMNGRCDPEDESMCKRRYWFTPKPIHEIKDFKEYVKKCDETWAKDFKYTEGDYFDDQRTRAYDYLEYFDDDLKEEPWATAKQEAFDLYSYINISEEDRW